MSNVDSQTVFYIGLYVHIWSSSTDEYVTSISGLSGSPIAFKHSLSQTSTDTDSFHSHASCSPQAHTLIIYPLLPFALRTFPIHPITVICLIQYKKRY